MSGPAAASPLAGLTVAPGARGAALSLSVVTTRYYARLLSSAPAASCLVATPGGRRAWRADISFSPHNFLPSLLRLFHPLMVPFSVNLRDVCFASVFSGLINHSSSNHVQTTLQIMAWQTWKAFHFILV